MFKRICCPRLVSVRCFSTTAPLLRVSPYFIFMQENARNPQLRGLSVPQRGKKLAQLWKKLPQDQKDAILLKAYKTPYPKRHRSAAPKKKRPLSPYNRFVKQKMDTPQVLCLPFERRMSTVAKMWKAQKAKTAKRRKSTK